MRPALAQKLLPLALCLLLGSFSLPLAAAEPANNGAGTSPPGQAQEASAPSAQDDDAPSEQLEAAPSNEHDDASSSKPASSVAKRPSLFGRPLARKGFHFHFDFGPGGGPDTLGLYHSMEIGWSVRSYTISLLHTFLQNKNVFRRDKNGPDEIGGFMVQVKGPLYFNDLSWKFATGVGGTVDQPDDGGFYPNPGFGIHYGVDLHFPIWPKFGPTLSVSAMNVFTQGDHHFGASLALGLTVF